YQLLNERGIKSARALGFGERFGLATEKFSYIITESVAGIPLDDFLDTCTSLAERRAALDALGKEILKMHNSGLCFPDLFARHVFVERDGDRFHFRLIDVSRLICRKRSHRRECAKDLAALNVSVLLNRIGRTDRMRVLRGYGELDSKEMIHLIAGRMKELRHRKKFREFFEDRRAIAGLNR
ncbi:MAG TPA: lipopolysaccharide kinase InaA family protein, partial [Tepidisphaeraceae bacterium]|nr:lipopolysaccharide kinase InaA family protein [Tepidisphaeraceae bacterium]